MLLSACLIVRDEAARLPGCLRSLRDLVDECVVVDTGSVDETIEVAEAHGARVVREPWRDSFAAARNVALENASGAWAFVIDADEEVVDTDVRDTRARLLADGLPDILLVRERLVYPDGKQSMLVAPRFIRLSSGIRYVHAVHEQLDAQDAPALLTNVLLHHHGYVTAEAVERKERRNLRLAELMPKCAHSLHSIARAALTLRDWERTAKAASELVERPDAPPVLRREAAVLGAIAAVNRRDTALLGTFLDAAHRADGNHPDVLLLGLMDLAGRYLSSQRQHESTGLQAARPPLLPHDPAPVAGLLRSILKFASPGDAPAETTPAPGLSWR